MGGYDSSRLIPNNVNFDLDSVQNPTLAVKSISVSGVENGGKIDLLTKSEADLFTIDSTTPFLWLPEKVCARFEQALGLQYDEKLQVYIYPRPEQQLALTSKNLTFEFSLSDLPASSDREILLSLSGNAFLSHSLSFGYPNWNGTYITPGQPYFPLRKAANSSQFVLGRSFLQETYLIVDFERNNFSLSQAKFPTNSNSPTLVDIYSPDIQIITRDQSSGSLNLALIIGASVGGKFYNILIF